MSTEMCCVHNSIIRGLNSIYHHAPLVSSADRATFRDFIGFSKAWYGFVQLHHDSEEEFFFKRMDAEFGVDTMRESKEEHEAFQDGLQRYHAYLSTLEGKEDTYSGSVLIQLIDEFSKPLMTHLAHELDSIMELSRFGNDELVWKIWNEGVEAGKSKMKLQDLVEKAPLALLSHDMTFEDGLHQNYPPMPAVLNLLIRYVFSLWYGGYWKFTPCDKSGQPKPTPAISN